MGHLMTTHVSQTALLDAFLHRVSPVQNALLVFGGSLLVALCAQVSLPLPFSPVPVTGQTFAVLLLGAALGPSRAAAALVLYLMEGAAGLPVFAPGGLPGAARFAGPTGGYLLAFPLAAFLLGWLVLRFPRRWWSWLVAALLAEGVILLSGTAWLKSLSGAGWGESLQLGFLPFVPGSFFKAALLALLLPASWWAAGHSARAQNDQHHTR
jgi:biotin transport system substrate-specific component